MINDLKKTESGWDTIPIVISKRVFYMYDYICKPATNKLRLNAN